MSSKDRAHRLKVDKVWRDANPEKLRGYRKTYRTKYPAKVRDRGYRLNYGIGLSDVLAMWERQEKHCACCDEPIKFPSRLTHVDHDHATKKVRGLVCHHCNRLLGSARDSIGNLRRAITYLKHNGGQL